LKEYSRNIVIQSTVGMIVVLLGASSVFAQTNQSSQQEQQQGNQTGNQSAAGGSAIPPRDVIQGLRNETTAGFSNTTDVENLSGSGLPSLSAPVNQTVGTLRTAANMTGEALQGITNETGEALQGAQEFFNEGGENQSN
jgi:hypothetical protein